MQIEKWSNIKVAQLNKRKKKKLSTILFCGKSKMRFVDFLDKS